ncbi:MAG: hypothetical protein IJG24_01770 [Selenomonadaceae bacterium]|nr:hypothetical protein [Selenomonadaceae bacterium]
MKKYLIKLNHGGASKGYYSYTLNRAKNTLFELKQQLSAFEDFTEAAQDCCSAR